MLNSCFQQFAYRLRLQLQDHTL